MTDETRSGTHISVDDIYRFLSGEMDSSEVLAFDDHLATCGRCKSMAAKRSGATSGSIQHALAAQLPEHLTFETMTALIDDEADAKLGSAVLHHLKACEECRDEIEDLRAFGPSSDPIQDRVLAEPEAYQSPLAGWLSPWKRLAFATGLLVLVVGAVGIWYLTGIEDRQGLIAEVPAPEPIPETDASVSEPQVMPPANVPESESAPAVTINDNGRRAWLSERGELLGFEGAPAKYVAIARSALSGGTFPIGAESGQLTNVPAARMSGADPTEKGFRVLGPKGKVIDSPQVTLSWEAVEGADSYSAEVFDLNFRPVASSGDINATRWATNLPRGRTYIWQVKALKDGEELRAPAAPEPEARFYILDATRSRVLRELRGQRPRSSLLLAAAYADAGMIEDAIKEMRTLVRQNPGSTELRRILVHLESRSGRTGNK